MMTAGIGILFFIIMACSFSNLQQAAARHSPIRLSLNRYQLLAGLQLALLNAPVFILGSVFGNQFLMEKTSANLETSAFFSSLIFLGIMIASPIMGYIADKSGNLLMIVIGYFILLFCSIILSLDYSLSYQFYFIIFMLIGAGCSTQNLIYPVLYQHRPDIPSTNMAIASVIFNSLGALLQSGSGLLLKISSFNIIPFALIIIFITGLILLASLRGNDQN